jgi:predicted DNA-binding ribbon-helix-helix protein
MAAHPEVARDSTVEFQRRSREPPHQGHDARGSYGGIQSLLGAPPIMSEQKEQLARQASPIRKRSVSVHGVGTSISVEEPFWQALEEIARAHGSSRAALINLIANERAEGNLSSAVRVFVVEHFRAASRKAAKS